MMQKTKIEWVINWDGSRGYTWNPAVGCLGPGGTLDGPNVCSYCYAKRINDRFKMIPDWTKPVFYPERLYEPDKVKKPSTIFVGSMCDLFGEWVPVEWILDVIDTCNDNPYHKFMFLTKNPARYSEFIFPKNCWLGTTITNYNDYERRFYDIPNFANKTFISIEPLLSHFKGCQWLGIDQLIVGAMTGPNAIPPKREWIESIKHHNIFYKENIKKFVRGGV